MSFLIVTIYLGTMCFFLKMFRFLCHVDLVVFPHLNWFECVYIAKALLAVWNIFSLSPSLSLYSIIQPCIYLMATFGPSVSNIVLWHQRIFISVSLDDFFLVCLFHRHNVKMFCSFFYFLFFCFSNISAVRIVYIYFAFFPRLWLVHLPNAIVFLFIFK